MNFSIIIITTFNRLELFQNCLVSIQKSIARAGIDQNYEILIGLNEKKQYDFKSPPILQKSSKVFLLNEVSPSKARNILINESNKGFILFLDDDILLPSHYIANSILLIKDKQIKILGGPDSTYPGSRSFEQAINIALKSFMTTLNTRKRHSLNQEDENGHESNLTLSNLWVKKSIFNDIKFDERFFRNEENILIRRIGPTESLYTSKIHVFHRRRNSLKQFLAPSFKSGFNRIKMYCKYPSFFDYKYIIPSITLLIHIIFLIFTPLIFLYTASLYVILVVLTSIYLCLKEKKLNLILPVILLQPLFVSSYALGQISCLIFILLGRDND